MNGDEFGGLLRVLETLRQELAKTWDAIITTVRAVYRYVSTWRQRLARAEWKWAGRCARMLSRHPDLVTLDGWMDRMYPGLP
ncbi:hypothetical protein [Parafrankia discariae]|uniref:hypothetical protein n=1 Tax=Parafrankia discariae TaxID=365528 RepID=UPI000377BCE2|nr:hypothetical protein [Parafrankia discariae]